MSQAAEQRAIAITGATGYIGSRLLVNVIEAGYRVVALVRDPTRLQMVDQTITYAGFDLSDPKSIRLPAPVNVVVHLAACTDSSERASPDPSLEIEAARRLCAAAKEFGARMIFVSSQSADALGGTRYARVKAAIEEVVLASQGIVVRPGLVYGGEEKGLFGRLCKLVRTHRFLPRLWPEPFIQPIHVDELCTGIRRLGDLKGGRSSVYCLAASEGLPFSRFLKVLARDRYGKPLHFFPVPAVMVRWLADLSRQYRWLPDLGSERLLGLTRLFPMETRASLEALSLSVRRVDDSTSVKWSPRHRLLEEARIIFSYILGGRVPGSLLRRYVRLIETKAGGKVLVLPYLAKLLPATLAMNDIAGRRMVKDPCSMAWRLQGATVIAETSPATVMNFVNTRPISLGYALIVIVILLFIELIVRVLRHVTSLAHLLRKATKTLKL